MACQQQRTRARLQDVSNIFENKIIYHDSPDINEDNITKRKS